MRKISADDERIELFKQSQFLVISLLQSQSLANFPHVLLQNEFFFFETIGHHRILSVELARQ